jgi:hypothetical protein
VAVGACGFVGLTGAVSACFDEVNGYRFFVCDRPMGDKRNDSEYFQQRTTVDLVHGQFLPAKGVMLVDMGGERATGDKSWR